MGLTRPEARSDAALLRGGAPDLATFYQRHERAVLAYFFRRTGRPELAADLAAETFARVIESRSSFDPALGAPRAWLFGIATNVLRRSYELGRVENAARRSLAMQPLVLDDEDLERITEAADELAVPALATLPPEQAAAVAGRIVDGLGYDELAARLDCSESVVRKRVSRGLRNLRAQLESRS